MSDPIVINVEDLRAFTALALSVPASLAMTRRSPPMCLSPPISAASNRMELHDSTIMSPISGRTLSPARRV